MQIVVRFTHSSLQLSVSKSAPYWKSIGVGRGEWSLTSQLVRQISIEVISKSCGKAGSIGFWTPFEKLVNHSPMELVSLRGIAKTSVPRKLLRGRWPPLIVNLFAPGVGKLVGMQIGEAGDSACPAPRFPKACRCRWLVSIDLGLRIEVLSHPTFSWFHKFGP